MRVVEPGAVLQPVEETFDEVRELPPTSPGSPSFCAATSEEVSGAVPVVVVVDVPASGVVVVLATQRCFEQIWLA